MNSAARTAAVAHRNVLVVEDTPSLAIVYQAHLEAAGFKVTLAETVREARAHVNAGQFAAIVLDLQLPDADGLEVLREVVDTGLGSAVVVVTADGSIRKAVEAIRLGAFDFMVKPCSKERLVTTVKNAVDHANLQHEVDELRDALAPRESFHGFIGGSRTMQAVYQVIENVANSKATVFITGESGTGKEVCAEAIHRASKRRANAFVPINCGAIPKDLIESELFGHLKGAFTGAIADRDGAAAQADRGTLFLDEICEMDLPLQTKLLRFLQTGKIQKVGAAGLQDVDVRVICATNRDPAAEVAAGRFREDLFYRLFVVPIHLPALRDRGGDILEIAEALLLSFSREEGKDFREIAPEAAEILMTHPWPGNVRELQNVIRNVVVIHSGPQVTADMVAPVIAQMSRPQLAAVGEQQPSAMPAMASTAGGIPQAAAPRMQSTRGLKLWEVEKAAIEAAIAQCQGSIPQAAKQLGVSPSTIYRKKESWEAEAGQDTA